MALRAFDALIAERKAAADDTCDSADSSAGESSSAAEGNGGGAAASRRRERPAAPSAAREAPAPPKRGTDTHAGDRRHVFAIPHPIDGLFSSAAVLPLLCCCLVAVCCAARSSAFTEYDALHPFDQLRACVTALLQLYRRCLPRPFIDTVRLPTPTPTAHALTDQRLQR
jgi:hypothetical protein